MSQQQHTQEPVAWRDGETGFVGRLKGGPHWQPLYQTLPYDHNHDASARIAELEKQRDELLEVFQLVIAEMEHRDRNDGNAPGHGHDIPGVWDSDNGDLAGKPCAWCAVWKKAKELCAAIARAKGGAA